MRERLAQWMSSPPARLWSRSGRLWKCPSCGKRYPKAGQVHSCCVVPLESHFRDRSRARELFRAFCEVVEHVGGAFRLSVAKTRIGLINDITFAAVMPRKNYLRVHILLRRKVHSPRFVIIDDGPPYWIHFFEIRSELELDRELRALLREAYEVGSGR